MPGDRLLGTLLRSLQIYTDQQDTPRLLGTASSLLTTLNNPLNVTLLTRQLLTAPAIWSRPQGLQTSMRCLSVFHSAAQALIRHENAFKDKSSEKDSSQLQLERTLPKDDWMKAVINGVDEHSPRWRHLLGLGGMLLGSGPLENENLSRSMRSALESALVTAANFSLEETDEDDELAQQSITLVLNHCFPLLPDYERAELNYDALLPILMRSAFHSGEGLKSGYFLGMIDSDVQPASEGQFRWTERSSSFQQIQTMLASPLLTSLGPLSRLIGHAIEQTRQPWLVISAIEDVEAFAKTLHLQWRQIKLSEIDASEEEIFLDQEALQRTTPQLWKLLRSMLFATVIILRSAVGRMLSDSTLGSSDAAPTIAAQALHTLRNLYFVSSRKGSSMFSQYTFVYLTTIDILATYPFQAEVFLQSIKPTDLSAVPDHPLDRCLDLFFLNTAEHFTLILPSQSNETLLVASASPYLAAGGNNNLLPIFEAAHSVMLAVFSAPQNSEITARHLPFYIEALFNVFPSNLTARQFRLAFKSLLRLTSPPAVLATTQPLLSATLLELLHGRAKVASTDAMFPHPTQSDSEADPPMALSEQAVLTLTIIDTLSQLPLDMLDEWLPLAADMLNSIEDSVMREYCKEHIWHMLVGGEMDPDRSIVCHAWWSTQGGRELVLFGRDEQRAIMSGAIPGESRDYKL